MLGNFGPGTVKPEHLTFRRTDTLVVLLDFGVRINLLDKVMRQFADAHFRFGGDVAIFADQRLALCYCYKTFDGIFYEKKVAGGGKITKLDFFLAVQ